MKTISLSSGKRQLEKEEGTESKLEQRRRRKEGESQSTKATEGR